MFVGYDTAQICSNFRVLSIPLLQYGLGSLYELTLYLLRTQNVVGRNARLASVQQFAPHYSLDSDIDIGGAIDENGTVR